MFNLFLPQTPLRTWRLGEIYLFFLSQRRRGRKELRCLICCYPNTAACSASLRDYVCFFSLVKARRTPRTSLFVLLLPKKPLRTWRLGEIYLFFLSQRRKERKGLFLLFPSASSAPLRESVFLLVNWCQIRLLRDAVNMFC